MTAIARQWHGFPATGPRCAGQVLEQVAQILEGLEPVVTLSSPA